MLTSFSHDKSDGIAIVIGATGGIGAAVVAQLRADAQYRETIGLSRSSVPALDLFDEASIKTCADHITRLALPVRLVVDATGTLSGNGVLPEKFLPEKSWRQLDPAQMAHAFAINAIGPALLMKHFLPLLPRAGKAVFATLSARVGSIGDNQLGGWYSYRASKAALNQLVRTAAIELRRRQPEALCVAIHPGTVDSKLSAPFAKRGLAIRSPAEAAGNVLEVIDRARPVDSGNFLDYRGQRVAW